MPRLPDSSRSLPSRHPEIIPLLVGIVGISIPVALLAVAAHGESTVVLILAVIAMLVVSLATLAFMFLLTDDGPE